MPKRYLFPFLTLLFAFLPLYYSSAQTPWWDTNWQYRKRIVIDGTKVDASLSDFPVLVKLTSANFDFSKPQGNGNDLRFIDHSGASPLILAYEIERHATSTQQAEIWVKIPSVQSGADTSFYLYYGNASAPAGQNSTQVWDTNYAGVWHMKEDPSGTAPQIKDSTSNSNHGTTAGAIASTQQVAGQVDGSLNLDGTNDYIQLSSPNSILPGNGSMSVTAWVKGTWQGTTKFDRIFNFSGINSVASAFIYAGADGTNNGLLRVRFDDGIVFTAQTFTDVTWLNGVWHQVAIVLNRVDNKMTAYLDGVKSTKEFSIAGIGPVISANTGRTGVDHNLANYLNGQLDELRVSTLAYSPSWVKASYHSENNTLLSYGIEENVSSSFDFYLTTEGKKGVAQGGSTSTLITA